MKSLSLGSPYSFFSLFTIWAVIILPVSAQEYFFPAVESQSNLNIFVTGVSLGDTTVIEMNVCNWTMDNYPFWFAKKGTSDAYYIEDLNGNTYAYLGEAGNSSKDNKYNLPYNQCDTVYLYFEALPPGLSYFHVIEANKNNSWDFRGINLDKEYDKKFNWVAGKTCTFYDRIKKQVNFLFSEKYTVLYTAQIEELNLDKGQVLLRITNAEIRDPSWVSFNYLEYKDEALRSARSNIGTTIWRNSAGVSIVIW